MRLGVGLMVGLALGGCAREVALVKGDLPVVTGSLEGGPWLVEDINGGGAPDAVRLEVTFDPGDDGASVVHGTSGCNGFRGSWQQSGGVVKLGPLAGTMMMCEPAKLDTERKLLQTLEAVTMVSFDASGAALLKARDGRTVKLRREAR